MSNKRTFKFNGKECEGIQIGYCAHSSDFDFTDWVEYTVYYNHQLLSVHVDLDYAPQIGYDEYTDEPIYGEPTEDYTVKVLYDNVIIPELDKELYYYYSF